MPLIISIISYMERSKWKPIEEERKVMEVVWCNLKTHVRNYKKQPVLRTNSSERSLKKLRTIVASETVLIFIRIKMKMLNKY